MITKALINRRGKTTQDQDNNREHALTLLTFAYRATLSHGNDIFLSFIKIARDNITSFLIAIYFSVTASTHYAWSGIPRVSIFVSLSVIGNAMQ